MSMVYNVYNKKDDRQNLSSPTLDGTLDALAKSKKPSYVMLRQAQHERIFKQLHD